MHHAIGTAAEPIDWLVAAKHFALAAEADKGMSVLGSAASEALGTGAWGAAVEIVDLMARRHHLQRSRSSRPALSSATALLMTPGAPSRHRPCGTHPEERGLVGLTLAAIYHMNGESQRLTAEVEAIADDEAVPSILHEVAVSWRLLLLASAGGCITDATQMLRRLAVASSEPACTTSLE